MTNQMNGNVVLDKTRELCEAIVASPNMVSIRERINAFMQDDRSREQYDSLMARGQALQEKRQQSLPLSGEEITEFERQREALLANPVASGFLDAQEEMHEIQDSIHRHIARTLELGRVPAPEDFESCSCDSGCGCH